jgi:hypothetical protein
MEDVKSSCSSFFPAFSLYLYVFVLFVCLLFFCLGFDFIAFFGLLFVFDLVAVTKALIHELIARFLKSHLMDVISISTILASKQC